MPVRGMAGRECPFDPLEGKTALDVAVFGYVGSIVVGNEIAKIDPPEREEAREGQEHTDNQDFLILWHKNPSLLPPEADDFITCLPVYLFTFQEISCPFVAEARSGPHVGNSLPALAENGVGSGPVNIGADIPWIDLDGPAEIGDSLSVVAKAAVGSAPTAVSLRELRIDLDGLVEIGEGFRIVAQAAIGKTPTAVSFRELRINLDGLVEIREGFRIVTEAAIDNAAVRVSIPVSRIDLDGLAEIRKGQIVSPRLP